MKLECPRYHHIAIKRVFYGVKYGLNCVRPFSNSPYITGYQGSSSNTSYAGGISSSSSSTNSGSTTSNIRSDSCCRSERGDCQVDDNTNIITAINTKCSGREKCDLTVRRVRTEDPCSHKSYTDYMTIVYDCVSVGDIVHFCTDSKKRGHTLYLSNAEYPLYLKVPKGGETCKCGVFTSHPKGISINSIDVLLAWSRESRICSRLLDIEDPHKYYKRFRCRDSGFYGFQSLYSRAVPNVTVTLESLPEDGLAYIWLQAKPNDADGYVEILCGQPFQNLLDELAREAQEAREREKAIEEKKRRKEEAEKAGKGGSSGVVTPGVGGQDNATEETTPTAVHSGHSDIMTIVWGIVTAGFILIAVVIIAMALHCKRTLREKRIKEQKPLALYPAIESEPLDMASYCRYTDEDGEDIVDAQNSSNLNSPSFIAEQHVCGINRSPVKVSAYVHDGNGTIPSGGSIHSTSPQGNGSAHRPNGFATIVTAADFQIHCDPTPSPPLPAGISTPPPSLSHQAGKTYRGVQYPGDLSLRFVVPLQKTDDVADDRKNSFGHHVPNQGYIDHLQARDDIDSHPNHHSYDVQPAYHQGHTTLPANRKPVLIPIGPKSPLGKRSKSVTFSQPVAMVTPLNSESDESVSGKGMKKDNLDLDYKDDGSYDYDNLHKLDIDIESFLPPPPPPLDGSDGSLPSPPPTPPHHFLNKLHQRDTDMIISIPRYEKSKQRELYPEEESPNRPMSTFSNSPSPREELKFLVKDILPPIMPPPPPPPHPSDLRLHLLASDSDDTAYMSDSSSSFWSPTRQSGKPMVLPKPQKAELFETGV